MTSSSKRCLAVILALSASAALTGAASAAGYTVLHSFCSEQSCADGQYAAAPLVSDASGNLFGTTALGGDAGWGTIFELKRKGSGYKYKRLHSFCAKANCTDGSDPVAGLAIDTAGNVYGTTKFGGDQNGGTAFELILSGGVHKFKLLHSFCAQGAACADGSGPDYDGLTYQGAASGLPYDGASPLYGTTLYGGENNAGFSGVVYRLSPPAPGKKKWKEKILYQFCALANCADGSTPYDGLTADASGNLFGVTYGGGTGGSGTVFQLAKSGKTWSETVLYNFCSEANCADGSNPWAPLTLDSTGALIGSATSGGAKNGGVIFRLVPDGANSQYSVLYNFCSQANCTDGYNPIGPQTLDQSGNIYGANLRGGDAAGDGGILYEVSGGSLQVLYTFCPGGNCAAGRRPTGGVMRDSSGNLFGTTTDGGHASAGVAFELSP